jgi:hypothetical protein
MMGLLDRHVKKTELPRLAYVELGGVFSDFDSRVAFGRVENIDSQRGSQSHVY